MIHTQPQLLQIPLDPGDVVYTPDWVAHDMVEFFKPSGRILEPCKGDGVFLKYLPPHTEWCEIQERRDFFKWLEPVDWIVGNPPYGKIFNDWLNHSYGIAKNTLYLLPLNKLWNSTPRVKFTFKNGHIKHLRLYGDGSSLGWDYGFPVGALHFQRGYTGPMYTTIYEEAL